MARSMAIILGGAKDSEKTGVLYQRIDGRSHDCRIPVLYNPVFERIDFEQTLVGHFVAAYALASLDFNLLERKFTPLEGSTKGQETP